MKSMTDMQELIVYAEERKETGFLEYIEHREDYLNRPRTSRPIHYISLFNHLEIDLLDKSVLELGPGWGILLEVARDARAQKIDFIDYNPYVYTYNRLNGFNGIVNDYYMSNAFNGITDEYDVIVSRGSVNVDRFERQFDYSGRRLISYPEWLRRLERLCKHSGTLIISPTYDRGEDVENPYLCHQDKVLSGRFYRHMVDCGYTLLPYVEDWTDRKSFPFTFIKRLSAVEEGDEE
jgi:hypothetical protein